MIVQRRIALALVLLQLALFGFFSQTIVFPAAMGIVAALSLLRWWTFQMEQTRVVIYGLLLGAGFYARWYLAPYSSTIIHVYFMDLGYTVSQYFLTLQVVLLYLERKEGLYTAFPLLGVATLMITGDIIPSASQNMAYHAGVLFFVALSAYYFSATRQRQFLVRPNAARYVAPALILVIVLGLGAISNTLLYRYQYELDAAFNNLMYPMPTALEMGTGLSKEARLGSVAQLKGTEGTKVAMRIYAEESPGYLRARAFDEYKSPHWQRRSAMEESFPLDPEARPNRLFAFGTGGNRIGAAPLEIWPDESLADTVFTDLHSVSVEIPVDELLIDPHRIVAGSGIRPSAPYTVYRDFQPSIDAEPLGEFRQLLTTVPEDLDSRVHALAADLFEGADLPEAKVTRVIGHFTGEYEYNLGVRIPPQEDPLTYFLLERPAAHCEYFASGAALLLRLGGVPTRYVTGYVVREENETGGYWVARSRDAHAWVEAWIDGTGWVTVEATPGNGVPQGEKLADGGYRWDEFKHRMAQLKEAIVGGYAMQALKDTGAQLMRAVKLLFTTWPGWLILSMLIACVVWWRRRKRIAFRTLAMASPHAELHTLLESMDATLAKEGLTRDVSETLHGFAGRIDANETLIDELRPAGNWYRTYAAMRYSGGIGEAEVEQLHQEADLLAETR